MSDPHEELGHTEPWTSSAKALPPDPARRHKWKFLAHFDKATKHHCVRCGTTRVRIAHTDRFPSSRYTTLKGIVTEGKVPPCPPP